MRRNSEDFIRSEITRIDGKINEIFQLLFSMARLMDLDVKLVPPTVGGWIATKKEEDNGTELQDR